MSDSGLSLSPSSTDMQQARISPSRWEEEAAFLLECASITINDSKEIEKEIEQSPFGNTIFDLLTVFYNERESSPDLMETTRDSTGVAANMQKIDDILDREHINSVDENSTISNHLGEEDISSAALNGYRAKHSHIKQLYNSEHQNLDSLCEKYEDGMTRVFRDQPKCIPIAQDKVDSIIQSSRERSQFIYLELKTNVAEAVLSVRKGMIENRNSKRRKRNFSKQATEILNEYFYSHIDSPYPCDEIKSELALQCNINLGQVNNWFGNKRIRYKRNIGKETNESENRSPQLCNSSDNTTGLNEDVSSSEDELEYIESIK